MGRTSCDFSKRCDRASRRFAEFARRTFPQLRCNLRISATGRAEGFRGMKPGNRSQVTRRPLVISRRNTASHGHSPSKPTWLRGHRRFGDDRHGRLTLAPAGSNRRPRVRQELLGYLQELGWNGNSTGARISLLSPARHTTIPSRQIRMRCCFMTCQRHYGSTAAKVSRPFRAWHRRGGAPSCISGTPGVEHVRRDYWPTHARER